MATVGYVCGVDVLFVFGIVLGPPRIIFSAIGMKRSRVDGAPLRGLVIAGFVCGIIATIGAAIIIAAIQLTHTALSLDSMERGLRPLSNRPLCYYSILWLPRIAGL